MLDINDVIEMLGASVMGAPVFKRSTKGATQVWRVEREGNKFRTIHGQLDGALITSEWTVCEGKNIGKKNETTPEQQAELEVAALYKKKTAQGKYTYDIDGIDVSTFISPMLAHPLKESKVTLPCSVQPKLDGVRCIATANGFFTRQGKPIPVVKHLEESLAPLFEQEPHLILDGELYNHIYKDRFEELISAIRQQKPTDEDYKVAKEVINFHVYDCPSCQGSYSYREVEVSSLLGSNDNQKHDGPFSYDTHYAGVYMVDHYTTVHSIEEIYRLTGIILEDGYEGAMVRLNDMPYENKRSYQLQKVKSFEDAEFEVLDIEEGKGNWSGVAKRACLWLPNAPRDEIIYPDDPRVASGEKDATAFRAGVKGPKDYCKKLLDNKADIIGKPATVTYFRLTAKGIPYLPIFKVIRDYE